jgi:hypothetical protein
MLVNQAHSVDFQTLPSTARPALPIDMPWPHRRLDFDDGYIERQGRITWYCLIAIVFSIAIIMMVWWLRGRCITIYVQRRDNDRQAGDVEAREVDEALSRMEANIKIFSEKEQSRKRRHVQRTMSSCTMVSCNAAYMLRAENTNISRNAKNDSLQQ